MFQPIKNLSLAAMLAVALATTAGCLMEPAEEDFDPEIAESSLSFTGASIYDSGTQCTVGGRTMHCCPSGYAMIGAHVSNNVFRCRQLDSTPGARFLDGFTQRNGMHACPLGSVMVGMHVGDNLLACQYPGQSVVSEYVDGNPATMDSYPMHVCGSGGYAMSGIHVGQNKFTCAR